MPSAHVSSGPYNEFDPGYFDHKEEEPSAGISSLTSEGKQDRSGSSGTPDLLSPAPDAESPSEPDPQASAALSSSASSTDGSTQGTMSSPPVQPDSSEESAPAQPAGPDQEAEPEEEPTPDEIHVAAKDLIAAAREAYDAHDYPLAESRLNDAKELDPSVSEEVDMAMAAVGRARGDTTE